MRRTKDSSESSWSSLRGSVMSLTSYKTDQCWTGTEIQSRPYSLDDRPLRGLVKTLTELIKNIKSVMDLLMVHWPTRIWAKSPHGQSALCSGLISLSETFLNKTLSSAESHSHLSATRSSCPNLNKKLDRNIQWVNKYWTGTGKGGKKRT